MTVVRPAFTLGVLGTSWCAGRYAGWVERLANELPLQPEALGPIRVFNKGQGGFTSSQILATKLPELLVLRPNHVFIDPGHVNSSADLGGGPAVSRAQTIADLTAMITQLRAGIPGVDITVCTMHAISATSQTIHPAYLDYAEDVRATAALLDVDLLDTLAGWPFPLDPTLTYGAGAFAVAPTATYLAMPDGTAWNAADKAATITLAQGDVELISNAAGIGSVRGNTAIAGKRHYELRIDRAAANYPGLGLASAAASLTNFIGADAHGLAIFGNGGVWRNNVNLGAAGFTFGAGDTIAVEVDTAAQLAYFMKGATRSAGFDISGIAGAIYPAATVNALSTSGFARMTPSGDGLHALNPGAVDVYHFPAVRTHYRTKMAAHWA